MAPNEKDLFRHFRRAESGPQKDASKNILRLHFNGVIISCITERKLSVYRGIEKLYTECESVLQTSNWEPRCSKNNPRESVWTNCWGAQKLGQLCYLLTVRHNSWLIIQLVCTNMMNCFKIKIRQHFHYGNPRTRQPRPLFHMQDATQKQKKSSRTREIKETLSNTKHLWQVTL